MRVNKKAFLRWILFLSSNKREREGEREKTFIIRSAIEEEKKEFLIEKTMGYQQKKSSTNELFHLFFLFDSLSTHTHTHTHTQPHVMYERRKFMTSQD